MTDSKPAPAEKIPADPAAVPKKSGRKRKYTPRKKKALPAAPASQADAALPKSPAPAAAELGAPAAASLTTAAPAAEGADKPKPKSRPKRSYRKKQAPKAGEPTAAATPPMPETKPAVAAGVDQPLPAAPEKEAAETSVAPALAAESPDKPKPKSRPRRSHRKKRPKTGEPTAAAAPPSAESKPAVAAGDDQTLMTATPAPAKIQTKRPSKTGRAPKAATGKAAAKETTPTPAAPVVKLLINAEEPEECRIALLENGQVESYHVTTVLREHTKNNIYKGRIVAIEPNLQAAFVDIGLEKNGFLHFGEIHPEYYATEAAADKHWKDLKIQEIMRKGQEVLVQVVKEATVTKGANLTTYLSLPGRYLVLMPGSDSAGISRKIEDEEQRRQLREMMGNFSLPEGIGYIIRTASKDITKTAISQDLKFLLRLWREIKKAGQTNPAPALLYRDQYIIAKFLRDHFTADIEEILVDSQDAYDQVSTFLNLLPARQRQTTVRLHKGSRPIFNQYNVENQIEQIYQETVQLPAGGSIVINPTEALVAIDVNSGRTSKDKNFEESIFLANMEAAAELARQVRLRDLGGLIVVDFIDMRSARHTREVEKQVKLSMKRDKAKVDFSRISKFGLMQISRQKMGSPIQMGSYKICEHCHGKGVVRSAETQALAYLRRIQTGVISKQVKKVVCRLPMAVARYLLNKKREDLLDLEKEYEVEISVEPVPEMSPEEHQLDFIKEQAAERGPQKEPLRNDPI